METTKKNSNLQDAVEQVFHTLLADLETFLAAEATDDIGHCGQVRGLH